VLFRASDRGIDQRALARIGSCQTGSSAAHRRAPVGLGRHIRTLNWLAVCCMVAVLPADAATASKRKPVAPSRQHASVAAKPTAKAAPAASSKKQSRADRGKNRHAARASHPAPKAVAKAPDPPTISLTGDLAVLKQAITLARQGKLSEARTTAQPLEPVAQKLVEWVSLRNGDSEAKFDRYQAFISANPTWPGIALMRRRAEGRLWQERRDAATVRGFIAGQPMSPRGRFALARVLMAENNRAAAEREIRAAWRSEELSDETEAAVVEAFGDVLTRSDHITRMDRRIGAKDFGGAMRAARRVGDDAVLVVKACAAANSDDGRKALEAVPTHMRGDLGYTLCRIHYLLRHDGIAAATQLMLAASPEVLQYQDTDEWWRERRTLARKLLDQGDAKTAYQVVRTAALPENQYYRAECHFMAGWIALRFLNDPARAHAHFAHVDDGSSNPIVLARAAYWRGRAHEAAGQVQQMRADYLSAARHSTAYYGQLARARLGLGEIKELRPAPELPHGVSLEIVRAAELLYAVGERDLVLSFVTDLAERSNNAAELAAVARLAARNNDARATLLVGKAALARGLPLDVYAFPDIGVPRFSPIGPHLDRSIVYSIVRTESEFNQRDVSPAKAVGLMQVTPEAGRDTAKRFRVGYDWNRLVNDAVYNTQMGAAELAALLQEYRGSYIMSFAGYNAGRGRVQQWVAQYGDPRDPKVDPIDWVERIPFAETRNYVQRVMENLNVYRVRFGAGRSIASEFDLHAVSADDASAGVRSDATSSFAR
jgi:soluble lytic murein transglycosylase